MVVQQNANQSTVTWFSKLYIWLRIRLGHILYQQPRPYVLPTYGDRVVRIGPRTFIKKGNISEARSMQFLRDNSSLPVPRVWHIWIDRHPDAADKCWFMMQYMPGVTWDIAWKDMSAQQKADLTLEMKGYMLELRELTQAFNPTQYIGTIDYQPCFDYRVSISERFGPFPDVDSFYRHLLWKVKMIQGESKANKFLDKLVSLKSSRFPTSVFSHADLVPRNIIVDRGKVSGIVDWEQAGWWPYWWDYIKAFYDVQLNGEQVDDWRQFVESIMEVYTEEGTVEFEISDIEGFPY